MPPRSDIEAIERPTVLSILYSMISVQQTNLLPENASQNDAIFPKSRYGICQTTSQCLSSYGCAIIVLYFYILYRYLLCMVTPLYILLFYYELVDIEYI